MTKVAASASDTFVTLDGLRGLGAIMIVVGHTGWYWGLPSPPSGQLVVDVFFLLSGFVIAYAYEPYFEKGMRPAQFMLHRIVRLYPLYLLGTLLCFAVLILARLDLGVEYQQAALAQLLPQLFMLPSPPATGAIEVYSFNGPAWTLFFELVVNLLYALAYPLLRSTRMLALIVVAMAALLALANFTFPGGNPGDYWDDAWGGFGRAGFGFFAGVLVFRLAGSPRSAGRPRRFWAPFLVAACPVGVYIGGPAELRGLYDFLLVAVLAPPMIYITQLASPPQRFDRLFIGSARISYALYILHWPFVIIAVRLGWRFPIVNELQPLPGIVVLVLSIGLAYVAERYYDRPVRRWFVAQLRKQHEKRRSRSTTRPAE